MFDEAFEKEVAMKMDDLEGWRVQLRAERIAAAVKFAVGDLVLVNGEDHEVHQWTGRVVGIPRDKDDGLLGVLELQASEGDSLTVAATICEKIGELGAAQAA